MKCPKCGKMMYRVRNNPYLGDRVYYYECKHCNYISDLLTDNNKPFGDNYKLAYDKDKNKDLENWNLNKKYATEQRLKKEHKMIVSNMEKKYGKVEVVTENDITDWLIDIYLYNKSIEENSKKVKKKTVIKKKKIKKTPKKKEEKK